MIGKYIELISDVARNSGHVWVFITNEYADKIETYEDSLRSTAEKLDDNQDIIEKLNLVKSELKIAKNNINNAEKTYAMVKLPGTPLIKFAEGNNYLRAAKSNLIAAQLHLHNAYNLMR